MAVFKCKRSGNSVAFLNENDIKQMRCHEGYDEVLDAPKPIVLDELLVIEEPTVRMVKKPTKVKSLL